MHAGLSNLKLVREKMFQVLKSKPYLDKDLVLRTPSLSSNYWEQTIEINQRDQASKQASKFLEKQQRNQNMKRTKVI